MSTIAQLFESGEQARQKGHFRNLVMLARIDGTISREENMLLNRVAQRLSLTNEQVKEIQNNPQDYPMIPPATREERYERFIQLIQLLTVDGQSDKEEEGYVKQLGIQLGFTPDRIEEKFPVILEHLRKGMTRESVLEAVI